MAPVVLAVPGAAQTQPDKSSLAAMGQGCTFLPGLLEGALAGKQCHGLQAASSSDLSHLSMILSSGTSMLGHELFSPGGSCPSCQAVWVVGIASPLTRLPQSWAAGYHLSHYRACGARAECPLPVLLSVAEKSKQLS